MALALMGIIQGIGLTIFPLIAQVLINGWGWRTAWLALGIFTISTGIIPVLLLMARRPEDMGLEPDPEKNKPANSKNFLRIGDGQSMAAQEFTEFHYT